MALILKKILDFLSPSDNVSSVSKGKCVSNQVYRKSHVTSTMNPIRHSMQEVVCKVKANKVNDALLKKPTEE